MNDYYIKIPNRVLKMKDLTSNDKLIYGLINSFTQKNGKTTVKNDFIADTLDISHNTVKSSLKRLKSNELITITNSNRYRIIKIKALKPKINYIRIEIDDEPAWLDETLAELEREWNEGI